MADLAAALVPQMAAATALPEGLKLAQHCMAQVPAATYRRAVNCLVTFDRRTNLEAIRVPTLLLAGEQDQNAPPAVMQKMADHITGSQLVTLPGVGHLQNLEAPDAFDAAVLDFLAQHAGFRRQMDH
jgi:pimeloyl-ACP methyl ester carboxylesterase